ncbi:Hypothetical predicted protein [Mytilus galloprovincialis]|uniref:Uncharacterized protein n=1 Tax=Mytilus galloprovincialis TaxID=29158 RepID=A0A8B6EMZ1_MYTGA|nr:Hypothetical predicted protein [Mytilus galloprovincialis]
MEKRKHKGLVCVVLFFSLLAFIAHGVAFGLPYWYRHSLSSVSAYGGLWQICYEISGTATCTEMKPWDSALSWYQKTCQGLATGATLFTLIGMITLIVKMCKGSKPACKSGLVASCFSFFIGGLMIAGATTVWALYQTDIIKESKSHAFWIECGAGGLFILSAILLSLPIYGPESSVTPTTQ